MAIKFFNRGKKNQDKEKDLDQNASPEQAQEAAGAGETTDSASSSSSVSTPAPASETSARLNTPNSKPTASAKPDNSAPATAVEASRESTANPEATKAEPASEESDNNAGEQNKEEKAGLFSRLKRGLSKTSSNLAEGLGNLFLGEKDIDDELFEEIEMQLLMADVGIEATQRIIDNLTVQVARNELDNADALYESLKKELADILVPSEAKLDISTHQPYVILMVGVNGVGKTTTIGKLARKFQQEGKSVMLAAGDTFRAAAVEQLQVWGERNNVPVIAQHSGADSASVLFDALGAAKSRGTDILIADTAGRLQNKDNLMEELRKVVRVMKKIDPEAPHEVMLVLDAGTGQNALNQAKGFMDAVGVTGLTITKLDGTAKGGIVFAISNELGLPIRFIGVGEQVEDLRPFEARDFVKALFQQD